MPYQRCVCARVFVYVFVFCERVCLYMYKSVCTYVSVCASVLVSVRVLVCACPCMRVKDRSQPQVCSSVLSLFFLDMVSPIAGACWFSWLVNPGICLSLSPQHGGYERSLPCPELSCSSWVSNSAHHMLSKDTFYPST